MNIITLPDPLLREISQPVEIGDKSIKKLAKDMAKLMYQTDGVGIAAPQVGLLKRFVVIDCDWVEEDEKGRPLKKNPITMINPVIVDHSEETVVNSEGCLSVPGINGDVERWEWVEVECYNEDYQLVRYKSAGLFGRCMQHERDHLDGKTFDENPSANFNLAGVVPGFREALMMLAPGGEGTFYIPGSLAYGINGMPPAGIGPDEMLVFKVKLLEVAKPEVQAHEVKPVK